MVAVPPKPDLPAPVKLAANNVLLAVYAPFGTDPVLSSYPDGTTRTLAQHPLLKALLQVAASGAYVTALIDRFDDNTYLIDIPAGRPAGMTVTSRWKQDMSSPKTLAGFLRYAHLAQPKAAIVLALEGHGAGFLPDLDFSKLSSASVTNGGVRGPIEWRISPKGGVPVAAEGSPVLPQGSPMLPQGSPMLPQGSPMLPANHMPLSTWGLGAALKEAIASGVPRLPVIHFNNCFNMSAEVMHTVAPYADYATGYPNYNFFTAGAAYPAVFAKLASAVTADAAQLAAWFADANAAFLRAKGNHPTLGSVVPLARMQAVAERIDDLADALLAVLRAPLGAAHRQSTLDKIQLAITNAQQFDTVSGYTLETPDELTDIDSLADQLSKQDYGTFPVVDAAIKLRATLAGMLRYADIGRPWVDTAVVWDFTLKPLAMNILCPDPLRKGEWDWRSPYYLDVNPDPTLPRVQPNIIDFVKVTDWVDFIIEYHKETKFVGLRPAAIPEFPVFNARFVPTDPLKPGSTPAPAPTGPAGGARTSGGSTQQTGTHGTHVGAGQGATSAAPQAPALLRPRAAPGDDGASAGTTGSNAPGDGKGETKGDAAASD